MTIEAPKTCPCCGAAFSNTTPRTEEDYECHYYECGASIIRVDSGKLDECSRCPDALRVALRKLNAA